MAQLQIQVYTPHLTDFFRYTPSFHFFHSVSLGETSTKHCSKGCPFIYEPRCASNGQTYDNECLMKIAECELGKSLETIKMGNCKNDNTGKCEFNISRLFL